jgi:hypothetical protein
VVSVSRQNKKNFLEKKMDLSSFDQFFAQHHAKKTEPIENYENSDGDDDELKEGFSSFISGMMNYSTNAFERHDEMLKEEQDEIDKHKQLLNSKLQDCEPFFKKTYTLKVYLSAIKPKIWRTIRVPGNITLHSLADQVIQPVMGWCRNFHGYIYYSNFCTILTVCSGNSKPIQKDWLGLRAC